MKEKTKKAMLVALTQGFLDLVAENKELKKTLSDIQKEMFANIKPIADFEKEIERLKDTNKRLAERNNELVDEYHALKK